MNEDKASRYHRLKRQVSVASIAWTLAVLAGLLLTGSSISLRGTAELAASSGPGVSGAHASRSSSTSPFW